MLSLKWMFVKSYAILDDNDSHHNDEQIDPIGGQCDATTGWSSVFHWVALKPFRVFLTVHRI